MAQQGQDNFDSFMGRLRVQLRERHDRLERLPFSGALREKTLPIESYVGLLRALSVIHAALERGLDESVNGTTQAIWHADLRKFSLIQKDLAFFKPRRVPDVLSAAESALDIAGCIRLRSAGNPVSLLGYLYVFEGSTRGSVIIRQWLASAFSLKPEDGLSYFTNYGELTEERWRQFAARMEAAVRDSTEQQAIYEAACEAYDGMTSIFNTLYPLRLDFLHGTAATLNPEAGRHPIPSDPLELAAALRASDTSWRRLSYYEMRYGERGKNFSDSDSAWLATLVDYDREIVSQQVQWLGRVLSARGLPRWTLEVHLEVLAEELGRANPKRMHDYDKLRCAVAELREARLCHAGNELASQVLQEFLSKTPDEWNRQLPQTVDLILSAVADEKEGIPNAVESLTSWLTDESRFPNEWIAAVRGAVQRVRC